MGSHREQRNRLFQKGRCGQYCLRLPAKGSNKTATHARFNVLEIFGDFMSHLSAVI